MSEGNGDTNRELLLQLNQKLTDFMADSKADRAVINTKIEEIKVSIGILNHNSTSMADRLTALELSRKTTTDLVDFAKRIGITLGGLAAFIVAILTIAQLLKVPI